MEKLRKPEQEPTSGALAELEQIMEKAVASLTPEQITLLERMDAKAESAEHETPQDLETLLRRTPEVPPPITNGKKSHYNPQTQFQAYGHPPSS